MSKFDPYILANIDTDIMASPMKKATIFLSYIKGELVKDWTKRWVDWMTNMDKADQHMTPIIEIKFQGCFEMPSRILEPGNKQSTSSRTSNGTWNLLTCSWKPSNHWPSNSDMVLIPNPQ